MYILPENSLESIYWSQSLFALSMKIEDLRTDQATKNLDGGNCHVLL